MDRSVLLPAERLEDIADPRCIGVHGRQISHGDHAEAQLVLGRRSTNCMHEHGAEECRSAVVNMISNQYRGDAGKANRLQENYVPVNILEYGAVVYGFVVHDHVGNACDDACRVEDNLPRGRIILHGRSLVVG